METINNRIKLCGLLDKKYSFDRLLISRLPRMLAVPQARRDALTHARVYVCVRICMKICVAYGGVACCVQFNFRPPVSRCVMRWVARYLIESVEFSGIAQSATAGIMLAANHLEFTGLLLSPARQAANLVNRKGVLVKYSKQTKTMCFFKAGYVHSSQGGGGYSRSVSRALSLLVLHAATRSHLWLRSLRNTTFNTLKK